MIFFWVKKSVVFHQIPMFVAVTGCLLAFVLKELCLFPLCIFHFSHVPSQVNHPNLWKFSSASVPFSSISEAILQLLHLFWDKLTIGHQFKSILIHTTLFPVLSIHLHRCSHPVFLFVHHCKLIRATNTHQRSTGPVKRDIYVVALWLEYSLGSKSIFSREKSESEQKVLKCSWQNFIMLFLH